MLAALPQPVCPVRGRPADALSRMLALAHAACYDSTSVLTCCSCRCGPTSRGSFGTQEWQEGMAVKQKFRLCRRKNWNRCNCATMAKKQVLVHLVATYTLHA